MIFLKYKERIKKTISLVLAVVSIISFIMYNGVGKAAAIEAVENYSPDSVASKTDTETNDEPHVTYGKANYPDLTDISCNTYRKLNYKVYTTYYEYTFSWNEYFYDFRTTWRAGCMDLEGKFVTSLVDNRPGFYGIVATADKDVVTYTVYTELDNVTVSAVEFRTYDNAQSSVLEDQPGTAHTFSVAKLPNGPYFLCIWFDYVHEDGTVECASTWQPVYVSSGNAYFAEWTRQHTDKKMEEWLVKERNNLIIDDFFQDWMATHGGNDLDAALRLNNITYPFYSNTERYPNEVSKWKVLAHDICPDENATDFRKAYLLHEWMSHNLVYDKRQIADANGNKRDEYLPYRWAENGSGAYSTWNTHIGVCFDFANIYAIMCRELGVPCRVVSDAAINHAYDAIYLNNRWELVDLTRSVESYYIENSKAAIQKFWEEWEGPGSKAEHADGFVIPAKEMYKIYGNEEWKPVEGKLIRFYPLDRDLCTKALLKSFGGKYNH